MGEPQSANGSGLNGGVWVPPESELRRLAGVVYNFLLYRVPNRTDAEDLAASTFERAWANRNRFDPSRASYTTWLLSIAANLAKDHLRRPKTLPIRHAQQVCVASHEEGTLLEMQREYLRKLIRGLRRREQLLVALKYGAGLSNGDIARIAEMSVSNVGTVLHRTVARLTRMWEKLYG